MNKKHHNQRNLPHCFSIKFEKVHVAPTWRWVFSFSFQSFFHGYMFTPVFQKKLILHEDMTSECAVSYWENMHEDNKWIRINSVVVLQIYILWRESIFLSGDIPFGFPRHMAFTHMELQLTWMLLSTYTLSIFKFHVHYQYTHLSFGKRKIFYLLWICRKIQHL